MTLHPCEHFVDLRYLPGMMCVAAISQQGIGFIEDQETLLLFGLFKSPGDILLIFPDPF
jgi:hypothetical protein